MPVRPESQEGTHEPVNLAQPLSAPSLAGQLLRVPARRGPWTYCVSPVALHCRSGRIVPRLAKAWHEPGLNGNGKLPGRGEGALVHLAEKGYVAVPHDMETVAFGRVRPKGTNPSTYLDLHRGILGGAASDSVVDYYCDAWTRPRVLGPLTRWERDEEGWLDFLGRCLKLVWTEPELDEVQIEIAVSPVIRILRTNLGRESIPAKQAVTACLDNLPRDYVPADLLDLFDAHHKAKADKRPRKAKASTT